MRRALRAAALAAILTLAACSRPPAAPTPSARPAQLPAREPTDVPQPTQPPGVAGLPGRLAFAAAGDLWIWEGERARRITDGGDAAMPALSPDGARVVFVRRGQSVSDLALVGAAGGEPQLLTSYTPDAPPGSLDRIYSSIWALYPAFSPDGAEVGFVSQYAPPGGSPAGEYRLGLYSMPPSPGAERTMLYTDQEGQIGRVAFTPDGAAILFSLAPDRPGEPKIYRYDRASGEAGELPGIPPQSYDPAVSPDGTRVAFAARHDGRTDIFIAPLAGGQPRQVTAGGAARAPAFSPDGGLLAFLAVAPGERGFDLWVLDLRDPAASPRQISFDMGIDADSGLSWARAGE